MGKYIYLLEKNRNNAVIIKIEIMPTTQKMFERIFLVLETILPFLLSIWLFIFIIIPASPMQRQKNRLKITIIATIQKTTTQKPAII